MTDGVGTNVTGRAGEGKEGREGAGGRACNMGGKVSCSELTPVDGRLGEGRKASVL